jgi:hypothetical protein
MANFWVGKTAARNKRKAMANSKLTNNKRHIMKHSAKLTLIVVSASLTGLFLLATTTPVMAGGRRGWNGDYRYGYRNVSTRDTARITGVHISNASATPSANRGIAGSYITLAANGRSVMDGSYRVDQFTKVYRGDVERLGENLGLSVLKAGQVVEPFTLGQYLTKIAIISDSGGGTGHGKHDRNGKHSKSHRGRAR